MRPEVPTSPAPDSSEPGLPVSFLPGTGLVGIPRVYTRGTLFGATGDQARRGTDYWLLGVDMAREEDFIRDQPLSSLSCFKSRAHSVLTVGGSETPSGADVIFA